MQNNDFQKSEKMPSMNISKLNYKFQGFNVFAKNFSNLLGTVKNERSISGGSEINGATNKAALSSGEENSLKQKSQDWEKLTNSEKQLLLDIMCWKKGDFNFSAMTELLPLLLTSIKQSPSFAIALFNSYELHLYLKSHFNYYSFDTEEQNYPEDDCYFVSKDFSFIFQYDKTISSTQEIEDILEQILITVGHEIFISKLNLSASDSFLNLQEEAYGHRNRRLQDAAYPSYEEALEWQTPIIKNNVSQNILINNPFNSISGSLEKTKTAGSYDSYSLIKTVLAVFEFNQANDLDMDIDSYSKKFKESMEEVLYFLKVGEIFIVNSHPFGVTDKNNAKYTYRAGKTFFEQLNKTMNIIRARFINTNIDWCFLGETIDSLADNLTLLVSKKKFNITKFSKGDYRPWNNLNEVKTFLDSLVEKEKVDIIAKYWEHYVKIKDDLLLISLNFHEDRPTFETLLLTRLVSYFSNGVKEDIVNWDDVIKFRKTWENNTSEEFKNNSIQQFIHTEGISLNVVNSWIPYIKSLIDAELSGNINLEKLSPKDFCHIGSVIIKKIV